MPNPEAAMTPRPALTICRACDGYGWRYVPMLHRCTECNGRGMWRGAEPAKPAAEVKES